MSTKKLQILGNIANSDAITAPATAAVGQSIVVKEVDKSNKPVAWEAADMATQEYVDDAISTIELTPGPQGAPGSPGVYCGADEPVDESVSVWVKDSGDSNNALNFIPTPSVAEVGQTVIVKEVDETGKPISWESADLSTGDGSYTLPTASPNTLGGVKPVAKSDDMTQSVGVDETGGLWTVPGSGGSGGGNASICNFTITAEQEVNGITVELPTTLNKFYIVEFCIVFGEVLTEKMALYSRQGGGSFHGYGTSLPENTKAATVFGLRFSDEFLHIGFNSAITYETNAYPKFSGMCMRISQTEKTITFYSHTSGVNFPAGTSISVWGVYEK